MEQQNTRSAPIQPTPPVQNQSPPIEPNQTLSPEIPISLVQKRSKFQNGWRGFLSTFSLIGGALVLAILINQFIFQSYEVDGSSMEPSLHNRDRLIIWKVPRTWSRVTGHDFSPQRGDIIVFHKPDGSDEQLIKRVIGLPGERVVVSDNSITVYNDKFPDGFNPDMAPYGKELAPTAGNVDVRVKSGEVFVSGDNRTPGASLDSRSSLGNIDMDLIVGKLVLRLYPFQNIDAF